MAAEGVEDIFGSSTPTKKSIAELNLPQTEKPLHYTYLKEFRVEQCPLFLQHKCTQHRPFTCFYWHFLNQKRRRPKKKKDGEFSYSPDVYCQQYNETTGECMGGEECPYLHRVAGDVERRYHLRYYKTSPCVYETDPRGYCVKNGAHCAFAHGPHDLRQPVYDIRELKAMVEQGEGDDDKQIVPDDVRWNDTNYVLANYKTESCKKPPRLCRQGYACPQYHNNRDRRRSPRKYKYRSTPCPNVKHGDEWGDPAACENGDSCAYCHTRTEQQFHPEIYKSTKCNDMQQTGQCPRGPFCAFAHIENGVGATSPVSKSGSISIIPDKERVRHDESGSLHSSFSGESPLPSPAHPRQFRSSSVSGPYARVVEGTLTHFESDTNNNNPYGSGMPTYEKAVGSGRRSSSRESDCQLFMDRHYSMSQSSTGSEPRTPSKGISASAAPFYPGASTVESVVGSALGDLNIDTAFDLDFEVDDLSISSSVGTGGFGASNASFMGQLRNGSEPVSIPGTQSLRHSSFTSQTSASPTSPGMAPSSSSFYSAVSMSRHGIMKSPKSSIPRNVLESDMPLSPKFQSPRLPSPLGFGSLGTNDTQRLTDEIMNLRSKLSDWEEPWQQAKLACEAWKREALELGNKAKAADREKMQWELKLAETEFELRSARRELESQDGGPCLHLLQKEKLSDLESQSVAQLKALFLQLKADLEKLEKIISRKESISCTVCVETPRCVVTYPCTHCVMCEPCANNAAECPFCKVSIKQKTTIFIPV